MALTDYYTRQEFLDFANDPKGERYTPQDIDRGQQEGIHALEQWAYSAWPTVTGSDGDGTAALPRSAVEYFDGMDGVLIVTRLPILAISSLAIDTNTMTANEDYFTYLEGGYVRLANRVGYTPRGIVVTYTYGFTTTPMVVKRPLMQAVKSLLDFQNGRGKVPIAGLTSYTTETATFTFPRRRYNEQPPAPWPWDLGASDAIRSYWRPSRPVGYSAV